MYLLRGIIQTAGHIWERGDWGLSKQSREKEEEMAGGRMEPDVEAQMHRKSYLSFCVTSMAKRSWPFGQEALNPHINYLVQSLDVVIEKGTLDYCSLCVLKEAAQPLCFLTYNVEEPYRTRLSIRWRSLHVAGVN